MQSMDILQSIFRWIHIVAGIIWIGHLYFFNFVNGPLQTKLDGETKKKVVPELMPRALFWFRWGAAWTWFSGVFLLLLVFYHGGILFESPSATWGTSSIAMVAFSFLAIYVYDFLMKTLGKKNMKAAIVVGFLLIASAICMMVHYAGFSYRGYVVHTGVMFGTIMAYNVWFRIWPAQKQIINAVKGGQAPDAALVAQAGARSRHNTYLSVPLIWTMVSAHTTWASSNWLYLLGVIIVGWFGVNHLYKKAGKVPGF